MDALLAPLLQPMTMVFMQRALAVDAVVAVVCAVLSCFMTLKGWALIGDAVSHAVLPGVVIAYALCLPYALGAFVFGVGSVGVIGAIKQHILFGNLLGITDADLLQTVLISLACLALLLVLAPRHGLLAQRRLS